MPCRDAPPLVESDESRPRGSAELLRVIEVDPHAVGQDTANWTTERLADYLGQQTGVQVTEETVRVYLHAHDYVCKRPTWTLRRKAEEKADVVGNAWSKRLEIIGGSMALAWSTGAMAGSMAESLRDALPMCSVSKCVLPWLVPSSGDELPS